MSKGGGGRGLSFPHFLWQKKGGKTIMFLSTSLEWLFASLEHMMGSLGVGVVQTTIGDSGRGGHSKREKKKNKSHR